MSNMNNTFCPKPVAELLDGKHKFFIPSYQRGYRWDDENVTDLLEDILRFVSKDKIAGQENLSYFLQPLVVKSTTIRDNGGNEEEVWEVLDGQQRLTTLYLILEYLGAKNVYSITYQREGKIEAEDISPMSSADNYYLWEARNTIRQWFGNLSSEKRRNEFKYALTESEEDTDRQVKFIWYETHDSESIKSIQTFNRLNKGQVKLTGAELIKALFVLDGHNAEELVMTWNDIEKKLEDNEFWNFISNNDICYQTRIDLIFDFITQNTDGKRDYAYRKFQNLYDYCHSTKKEKVELDILWSNYNGTKDTALPVASMQDAWREVKKVYNLLVSWYEDDMLFHYVGFLAQMGVRPHVIHNQLLQAKRESDHRERWSEEDVRLKLRQWIMTFFTERGRYKEISEIDNFNYESNSELIRRLLLLFNVEVCLNTHNQRFSFNKYRAEAWDIEHIDSQNESALQTAHDRLQLLRNSSFILKREPRTPGQSLRTENVVLAEEIDRFVAEKTHDTDGNVIEDKEVKDLEEGYKELYRKIIKYYACEGGESTATVDIEKKDKHNISNLTLLNSKINRSYKDAPFPYKRYCIIEEDKCGNTFIPICTRNVFLKYYTESSATSSHLDAMRWNSTDRNDYLKAIHDVVDPIFNTVK